MVTKKRVKLISVILAMLATVSLICASVITAAASTPEASYVYIVEQYGDFVNASGIIKDDALVEGGNFSSFITNPLEEQRILQAWEIVRLAEIRVKFEEEEFSVERIHQIAEPKRLASNELLNLRAEALELFKLDGEIFAAINWQEQLAELEEAFNAKKQEIVDILEGDKKAYVDYVNGKAKSVADHYDALLEITKTSNGTEYSVYGYYSNFRQTILKDTLDISVENIENDNWKFVDSEGALEYDPKNVEANKQLADEFAEEAIKALDGVPKNDFEAAHQAFMDFINLKDENENFDYSKFTDEIENLKDLGAKALKDYENRFSANLKAAYETKYNELVNAIEEIGIDPNYVPVKVYSISDKHNVVKIVAKYANGTKKGQYAQVIPEGSVLYVYSGSNSSAKKTVTKTLKESDKSLSVAYYLTLRVEKDGYKYFKLPTEIESETSFSSTKIAYEITINLEGFYNKYCKQDTFQKNKLNSIVSADEVVSKLENASICYGYESGEAKKLDYKLEGGELVFTTTSHLNNLCIAGFDLASFVSLSNPIFWVVCLIALIILIILIATIIKHVRYTIKFVTNGGSRVRRIRAAKGEYFIMPNDPVKPNYVFAGWYTDKAFKHKFFGNCMTRRRSIKLYAKWSAPVSVGRLVKMYDSLRDLMRSYKKESFKAVMGLAETEKIATMYFMGNHIQLNLALDPEELHMEGISVFTSKEKKYAEVPAQLHVSTEESFLMALELINRVLLNKGLQKMADYVPGEPSSEEERKNGFTYVIRNAKVASTAEDYFDLLRIALKSYSMEENNGKFKPGDKVTLARIYIEKEVACLYLPAVKGEKALKGKRKARFEDTPVEFKILVSRDMLEAYELIDKVMKHNGLAKNPENANDLKDVKVPATNGFAYTLVF